MEVQRISDTVQKFNGESYYRCGDYFQRKGKRLHRAVWEYHNGEIPEGYHIHHADKDKANNSIDNLELVYGNDHLSKHMHMPERVDKSRQSIKTARIEATKWHGSPEGIAFHSKLGKENWDARELHTYTCSFCGKEFQTKYVYPKGSNHFCHPNCKAKHRRWRLKNESEKH